MDPRKEIKISRSLRRLLRYNALWPQPDDDYSETPKSWLVMLAPVCTLPIIMEAVGIAHMKVLWDAGYSMSEDYTVIVSAVEMHFMILCFLYHQRRIAGLMGRLSHFSYGKPPGFDELNDRHDFNVKIIFWYVFLGVVQHTVLQEMTYPSCRRRHLSENCGFLASSTPTVLSMEETPLFYSLYFLMEFTILLVYAKTPLTISYLVFELVQHIVLRIEHLNEMITECFDCKEYDTARKKFAGCVEYHNLIINITKQFNRCFELSMLAYFAMTAIVLACTLHHIMKEQYFGFIIYVVGFSASFFMACWAGQQLTDASLTVADAAYNSRWHEADLRLQKGLVLLIMRSQRPLYVKAGSFDHLSFALFLAVMKTSYSVLTLLN